MTDWHLVHLVQYSIHGAGLIFCEAASVSENGRISPNDAGIWKDEHIAPMKRVTNFVHSLGGHIGIQIGHAGRKASTYPPFHPKARGIVPPEEGGWKDLVAPTSEPWSEAFLEPLEMSLDEIKDMIQLFKDSAIRASKAGFDVLELHGAHGYLIHQFLSPLSNKRTDQYGGSFENRIRFLIEIVNEVKKVWPEDLPVFVRLSCTDWVSDEESWNMAQTCELSKRLYSLGVDLIDCSSAGNSNKQNIPAAPGFQVPFAAEIRKFVPGLLTGAVGLITEAKVASKIIQENQADLVFMAREFLRNPAFVQRAALELGVPLKLANQYERSRPRPKHEAF